MAGMDDDRDPAAAAVGSLDNPAASWSGDGCKSALSCCCCWLLGVVGGGAGERNDEVELVLLREEDDARGGGGADDVEEGSIYAFFYSPLEI